MQSKGKPKKTAAEDRHVGILKLMPCCVCGEPGPSDVHEQEQGLWFTALPLCQPCHTGKDGWHGTRLRWTLRKMDPVKALDIVIGAACYGVRT